MSKKKKKIEPKVFPWNKTEKRFVGFLDIMGFKDMVARNSHQSIYDMMKKVSESVRSVESVFSLSSDEYDDTPHITMMLFSDSIMIFSRDGSDESMENFIGAIYALSADLLNDGIPFKGAIAFGEMTIDFDYSIFFGQPLIDAFLLQEELKFYGVAVHASVELSADIEDDESIIEYNCPFKQGVAKHLTIIPGVVVSEDYNDNEMEELKKSVTNLRRKTSGALRKYIDNTMDYLNFVQVKGKEELGSS